MSFEYLWTGDYFFRQVLGEPIESFQYRRNFLYRRVEVALQYSQNWGYHAELELVVSDMKQKVVADSEIKAIAQELGIGLMTEAQLRNFINQKELELKKVK